MDWKEYSKDLLIFQVKVFSLPIEDVTREKIDEFKEQNKKDIINMKSYSINLNLILEI